MTMGCYSEGMFEYYLYALVQTQGKTAAKEAIAKYLEGTFEEVQRDMTEELEEDDENEEGYRGMRLTAHKLEEMHKMTSYYNEIVSEGFKPEIKESRMRLYFYREDCFLKDCLIHDHM